MYKDFFGMKNTPFVRGIPVNALYSDSETDEINARLLSAAKDQSFALLVGDSGIGKTTAIRRMRNGLSESEYTVLYALINLGFRPDGVRLLAGGFYGISGV